MLHAISNYTSDEASGIPRNATLWVQFNKTLNTDTVSYVTVSVASPSDGYSPIEGTVSTAASSGGYPDTIIKFDVDEGFDAYKRYGFFIQGGSQGIKAYDGDTLNSNLSYYFTTGGGTTTNDSIPATGVPDASSWIPIKSLQVLSTWPENYDTNQPLDLKYIKIQFNDAMPTGINLYDYITLTSKDLR